MLKKIIVFFKAIGVIFAIYNLFQYSYGNHSAGLEVGDDVYIHGVPMVRVFISFLIIAISGLAESIISIRENRKIQSN